MTDVKTKYREPWFLSNDNGDETWCITDAVETFPIADASQAEFGLAVNGTIERAAQPRQIAPRALGRVIWQASQADEGSISVMGADIVAAAVIAHLEAAPVEGEVEKNRDERDAKYFHDGWFAALGEVRLRGDRKVGEFLIEQLGEQS